MQRLLPLLTVTAYFLVALAIYQVRVWRRGLGVDAEVTARPASPLLGRYFRNYIMWVLAPYERALVRLGVSPNALTLASLAAAFFAGVLLATGHFAGGGWLYLLTGMLDILDGRVARHSGRVTRGGAYFDSVIDRYAELFVFSGLAIYYRSTWVLGVVLAAAIGSFMVSYARARGEALGVDVKVGTMQRPERLFYLGLVLAHSPVWEAAWPTPGPMRLYPPAIAGLILLGFSANVTAVRRINHTMRHLADPAVATPDIAPQAVAEPSTSVAAAVAGTPGASTPLPEGVARRLLSRLRPVG